MIVQRFTEEGLVHFSYLIGDENTGAAAVIDARRDADVYMEAAHENGLEILHVLDTHIHADYVSGSRELSEKTGAVLHLSGYDENELYEVSFDHEELYEQDVVEVGNLALKALHTPGHTPEHLSYLLYDRSSDTPDRPLRIFSGDFLFVGSLGRPDLLGEQHKRELARELFQSVQKIKSRGLPDDLVIHPAHGAGSLCGAELSEDPESTLEAERENNPYFDIHSESEFIRTMFDRLGEFPPYYPRMKETNSEGTRFILPVEPPPSMTLEEVRDVRDQGGIVLDLRPEESFVGGHIPGSINLTNDARLNVWGPWVLEYDRPILFVGDRDTPPSEYESAYRRLARVELDGVQGYLDGGFASWLESGQEVQRSARYDARDLEKERQENPDIVVLDVRKKEEFDEGHIPDARWLMVGHLPEQAEELAVDREQPIVTYCSSGYRSSLAISLLERSGYRHVGHLVGGFPSWEQAGKTISREPTQDYAPHA